MRINSELSYSYSSLNDNVNDPLVRVNLPHYPRCSYWKGDEGTPGDWLDDWASVGSTSGYHQNGLMAVLDEGRRVWLAGGRTTYDDPLSEFARLL